MYSIIPFLKVINIVSFYSFFGNLYVQIKKQPLINKIDLKSKRITAQISFPSSIAYQVNNIIFSGKNCFIENDILKYLPNLNEYFFSGIWKKELLLFAGSVDAVVYNINTEKVITKIPFGIQAPIMLMSNAYIGGGSGFITFTKYLNNSIKWQLKFSEITNSKNNEVFSEIIHHNEKLFFFLSDGSNATESFVVDINTGNVLHRTTKLVGWLKLYNEKIYSLQSKAIVIMDANTYETETIELNDTLAADYITLEWNKYIVDGKLLYFADAFKPLVGIIDLKTKELLWHTLIEVNNKNLQKVMEIKLDNTRLYVLTSDNTLHIFEKEPDF